jgi:L-threonylcarbamoyladenylate synthase
MDWNSCSKINKVDIANAATILQRGGLVAFPTETVYGLGADAKNPEAVARIFAAKGRPVDHPVIVHLASFDQLKDWAREINPVTKKLAQHFWPGPLTLILPRAVGVLDCITGGQDTVGVRIPSHPVAQTLLKSFGSGIAAPSANKFGQVSPTQAAHVQQELGDVVNLILDGGECAVGIESTIVDVSGRSPRILRPGIITASEISTVLGENLAINSDPVLRVSGNLASHYAPHTPLRIVTENNLETAIQSLLKYDKSIAVLARHSALFEHPNLHWINMPDKADAYAHTLYACLRAADQLAYAIILVEEVPATEAWVAVQDRLQKAAIK